MKSLEARSFIAIPADIEAITRAYLEGRVVVEGSRETFLKALVATIQAELDSAPRVRTGKAPKLEGDEIDVHLRAMNTVYDLFYAAVIKAVKTKARDALEANKMSNFARGAKSTLKAWIQAGGDVRTLPASRVTKGSLREDMQTAPEKGAAMFKRTALRWTTRIEGVAKAYAATDKQAAIAGVEGIMSQLARMLTELGASPVRDAERAIRERRPLKVGGATFMPVAQPAAPRAVQ